MLQHRVRCMMIVLLLLTLALGITARDGDSTSNNETSSSSSGSSSSSSDGGSVSRKKFDTDSEANAYVTSKYQRNSFAVSGVTGMQSGDRKKLADSITANEVIDGSSAIQGFFRDVRSSRFNMTLPKTGTADAPRLNFSNWGQTCTRAIILAYIADSTGFQSMGLVFQSARKYYFLFSVDRLNDAGNLTNNETFEFLITLPNVLSGLIVRTYDSTNTEGVDVTTESGSVVHLGLGVWRVLSRHTSALSGEAGNSSTSNSNGAVSGLHSLPTFLMALTSLFLAAAMLEL